MNIIQSGLTDVGQKRSINQDSILTLISENRKTCLSLVADGMGGHTDGEIASGIIKECLIRWWDSFDASKYENNILNMLSSLQDVISAANNKIFDELNKGKISGSTCILLFIHNEQYGAINAGDSHIYMRRGFSIESIMVDDVWENQSIVKESYTKKQIAEHPNCGKLVNAIGTSDKLMVSSKTGLLKTNDTFIICSDGLYKYCPFKHIKKALWLVNKNNIDKYVNYLKRKTYDAGAKDNISIIIVKCLK